MDGDFVSYVPYIWKFHSGKFTKRQKAERPSADLMGQNDDTSQWVHGTSNLLKEYQLILLISTEI